MKRFISFALALVMCMSLVPVLSFTASADASGDFSYSVTDGAATINMYIGADADLVIPDMLDGCPVMAIDSSAFMSNEYIKNVTVPAGIMTIGDWAFAECKNLEYVVLSEPLSSLSFAMFQNCINLKTVELPEGIGYIPTSAFSGCENLTDVYFNGTEEQWNDIQIDSNDNDALFNATIHFLKEPEIPVEFTYTVSNDEATITGYTGSDAEVVVPESIGDVEVVAIGDHAFDKCSTLTSITMSEGVKVIGDYAFVDCSQLEEVNIPDSVTTIGEYAFQRCKRIGTFYIPSGVTTIGEDAFFGCTSLKQINVAAENLKFSSDNGILFDKNKTKLILYPLRQDAQNYVIPDSVTRIGDKAFYGCKVLTEVTIPDGVTYICNWAFAGCSNLATVTIPDSVTVIDDRAFYLCSSLTNIEIPDGVTVIGNEAFATCDSLTSITIPDSVTTIGEKTFSNCRSLVSATISDNVTSIGDMAFYCCESLASVDIGESTKRIGNHAFAGCNNLTDVKIPASVTIIDDSAFYGCPLTDVDYEGTEEEWGKISIGSENGEMLNANIHFTEAPEAAVLEYVLGLNAFNKENMVFGSNVPSDPSYPTVAPVLDNRTGALIFIDAMHWDYMIPAEYAANGEAFNAMDLSKTAPWAVEAYKLTTTVPMLRDDMYAIGFARTSYTKDDPAFVAFRLKVDAPGEYVLKAKAVSVDYSAVPAVYFFKDGTEGVVNGDVFTYPASSKIGYFDTVNSKSAYATLGTVNVERAGEYIITFVGDPTSAELNESYAPNNMLQMQPFSLSGIKLVPSDNEEVAGITLWADNKNLFVGDEIALDLSADMSALGEVELDASDVTFSVMPEGVVSVSDNGVVTAVGVGEATVTATLKSDSSKTASISFKNIENPNGFVYTVINEEVTIDAYEGEIDGPLTIPTTLGGGYPVRIIGNDAFSSCWETLTELVIPDGVTTIGIRAFDCCGLLSKIKIPASVTVIEESAFGGCDSLTDVYYGGTEEEWNEISIGEVNDSLLNATIHFAGETPACDVTVYTEAKASVAKGSKFTYTVSLEGTYDGFAFDIVPAAGFTITEMTASNSDINVDELTGKFRISVLGALGKVDSEKEAILTVSVEVEEDAEIGPCELGLTNLLVTDDCGDQIVNIKYEYATIEVKDWVPGDMNGDEKFDYVDVVKLYAFFREKAEIEEYIDVDVNGDGVFSYLDVSKLYAIYRGKAQFN